MIYFDLKCVYDKYLFMQLQLTVPFTGMLQFINLIDMK